MCLRLCRGARAVEIVPVGEFPHQELAPIQKPKVTSQYVSIVAGITYADPYLVIPHEGEGEGHQAGGNPAPEEPPTRTERLKQWRKDNPKFSTGTVVVLLVCAAAGVIAGIVKAVLPALAGTGSADPAEVDPGASTKLTVTVTPGTMPDSTGVTVTADLSPLGLSQAEALTKDTTNPNRFSTTITAPANTAEGARALTFTVKDGEERTATGSIVLTVGKVFTAQGFAPPAAIARSFMDSFDVASGDAGLKGSTIKSVELVDTKDGKDEAAAELTWTQGSFTGKFSVMPGMTKIGFQTGEFVKDATITQATVRYRAIDDKGRVSKPGTLTLTFSDKLVAFDLASPPALAPFDVVAAAFAPNGVDSVILDGANSLTQTTQGEGTWTVDPATKKIGFVPESSPTSLTSSVKYRLKKGTEVSEAATLTFAAMPITLGGVNLTIPRAYDAAIDLTGSAGDPALKGKTLSRLQLTLNSSPVDSVRFPFGEFTVDGVSSIRFKTKGVVKKDVTTAAANYLVVDDQKRSGSAAVTLTFDNTKPAAGDVAGGSVNRLAAVPHKVSVDSFLPDGFVLQKVELLQADLDAPVSGGTLVTSSGSWSVDSGRNQILFDPNNTSKVTSDGARYRLNCMDAKGATVYSNAARVTVSITDARPMARSMLMRGKLAQAQTAAVDVLSYGASKKALNGDSVTLFAVHDLGQETPPLGAGLTDDGKALYVAGEGVWKVTDLGAITFTPDAALRGAPSPVSYCFADVDGNISNLGLILMDPQDEFQASLEQLAASSNEDFWKDFQKTVVNAPAKALAQQDLYIVIATLALTAGTMVPSGSLQPVSQASLDSTYTAWSATGKTPTDLYTLAEAALPGAIDPAGFAGRYWRLALMAAVLGRELGKAQK